MLLDLCPALKRFSSMNAKSERTIGLRLRDFKLRLLPSGQLRCSLNSTNSPGQISLLDAGDILLADEGGTEITASREANVLMDDGQSPAGSEMVSLFSLDLVAIKVLRQISWLRAHHASAVSMQVSYWERNAGIKSRSPLSRGILRHPDAALPEE